MKTELNYPSVSIVLKEMQENARPYWRITYEYPDCIGVWHPSFISNEQFIFLGDINGHFGFNDEPADKVNGSMEGITDPAEIVSSFWAQLKAFYPDLITPTREELAYIEGAKDAISYLSEVFDGVEDTDIWADYFGEDEK